ncbi:hypothetical protein DMI69_11695 [Escherichia coli]|nr:hypothetical protein [Escherichia coli]
MPPRWWQHLACEGLLSGQCDMALAGGVTFRMEEQRSYESHGDGLQAEGWPDSYFDAQASGTVYSSGLGMVLLKRATDAQVQGITSLPSSREAPSTMMAVRAMVIPMPGVDGQEAVMIEAHSSGGDAAANSVSRTAWQRHAVG